MLGSAELVDHLIQSSRPHLFSNALAPSTACAAIGAIEVLDAEPERIAHLRRNVARMREGLMALGYDVVDSPSAIIPIIAVADDPYVVIAGAAQRAERAAHAAVARLPRLAAAVRAQDRAAVADGTDHAAAAEARPDPDVEQPVADACLADLK